MKVWILTKGSYSDFSLVGVFSTKEKADAAAYPYPDANETYHDEVDAPLEYPHGKAKWSVSIGLATGDCGVPYKIDPDSSEDVYELDGDLECSVWAKDEAHAIKIASEKRRQWLVEHLKETPHV